MNVFPFDYLPTMTIAQTPLLRFVVDLLLITTFFHKSEGVVCCTTSRQLKRPLLTFDLASYLE